MYQKRIKLLQDWLNEKTLDSLFITNFYNILYLTGLKTLSPHEREAFVLATRRNIYIFTDGRYFNQFKFQILNFKIQHSNQIQNSIFVKQLSSDKGLMQHLQEIIEEEKISSLGFEREDIKYSEYDLLHKSLRVELKSLDKIILKMREIKTHEEIEKIKKACEIGDRCLTEIMSCIQPGIMEKEIAWNIERWLRIANYELSFDPIVAVDANGALPHYDTKSGGGLVKSDSIVLIDFGVKYQDYCSDISRMFFMKDVPGEIRNAYEILKKAQVATIKQIIVAKKLNEVDKYCREVIANCACLPARQGLRIADYPHSTGHGIGLEVHEYPKVSAQSSDVVCANQAFTIEPGIYVPGKWGMRVEDTVTINEKNEVKILTLFPIS